jgi:hypothetical protein
MARKKWEIVGESIFITILPTRDNMIMFVMKICEFMEGIFNSDKEEEYKNGFGFQSSKMLLN